MKYNIFAVIALLLFLLTSCVDSSYISSDETSGDEKSRESNSTTQVENPETPTERVYTFSGITYSEPTAQYAFRAYMYSTDTEHAKYFFESSIAIQDREACIEVTEMVLSRQNGNGVIPEIYIFAQNRYNAKYIFEHKLYCSIQNWKSVEYVTDVLLAVYGEEAHYGIVIGYANYLLQSNNLKNDIGKKLSLLSVIDVLDLNYLCFDENFTTSSDIAIAREIALHFADSYITRYGESRIQELLYSLSNAVSAFTEYYGRQGISYIPSSLQYAYGGQSYSYIVYSNLGTFYVTKDWVDMNAELNPLIEEGFLLSNYKKVKNFFEINIQQMEQYQALFKLNSYNNDLDIILTKPISASKNSFYQSVNHRIYLYNIDSLMHEYIHALTMPTSSKVSWQVEGFARYFSYYYDYYGMALLNQDYNNTTNSATTKYIHEYIAQINRPIDMAKDYCEIENISVYYFGFTDPNSNYAAGSSFVQYLVKQYGIEAIVNYIYGGGDTLPKDYNELVIEWNEYIKTNYANYGKYEK